MSKKLSEIFKDKNLLKEDSSEERFRASIYVEVFIKRKKEDTWDDETDENIEGEEKSMGEMLEEARGLVAQAKDAIEGKFEIGYAYIGGVARNPSGQLINPELDKI